MTPTLMKTANKKHLARMQQNPAALLLVGCVFAGVAFVTFLWATDTAKILAYTLFFVCTYYAVIYLLRAAKIIKNNNQKLRK